MKPTAIYVRVSTGEQSTEIQLNECKAYLVARGVKDFLVYEDHGLSGTKANRPKFQELLRDAVAGKVSSVLVYKLDRFSRSLTDLVNTLQVLRESGVGFASVRDQIDLSTASGRFMMQILGSFSELEASLIRERVRAGQLAAKAKGVKFGRKRLVIDPEKVRRLAATKSYREISEELGISTASISRILNAHKAA